MSGDGWSQVPAPTPLQQRKGAPAAVQSALCGHPAPGSPSKQPVALALTSRQKPQKTLFWPLAVLFTAVRLFVPVESAKPMGRPPMFAAVGGGQSWVVGKLWLMLGVSRARGYSGERAP